MASKRTRHTHKCPVRTKRAAARAVCYARTDFAESGPYVMLM